jgi:hypothetical protein
MGEVKRIAVLVLLGVFLAFGIFLVTRQGPPAPSTPDLEPSLPPPSVMHPLPEAANPFGTTMSRTFPLEVRLRIAEEIGVAYYRTSAYFTDDGIGYIDDVAAIREAGFLVAMNVRNYGGTPLGDLEEVPSDLREYQRRVKKVVEAHKPAIIIVSNEENLVKHFPGTPEQYGEILAAACDAAHELQIPCATGGMLAGSVNLLVYQHYLDTGRPEEAQAYRQRAFEPWQQDDDAAIRSKTRRLKEFVDVYRQVQPDYVNLHWYMDDPQAFSEAIAYFQEATGRPVITNEFGQRRIDPDVTVGLMQTIVDLQIPIAIFYNNDSGPGGPRALINGDGSLRPTGQAARDFIADRFGG